MFGLPGKGCSRKESEVNLVFLYIVSRMLHRNLIIFIIYFPGEECSIRGGRGGVGEWVWVCVSHLQNILHRAVFEVHSKAYQGNAKGTHCVTERPVKPTHNLTNGADLFFVTFIGNSERKRQGKWEVKDWTHTHTHTHTHTYTQRNTDLPHLCVCGHVKCLSVCLVGMWRASCLSTHPACPLQA